MDLESLKSKVTELGGNQFESLSERTVDHMLNREIARNSEDSYYTDEVLNSIVSDLKEMDGNLHYTVGKKNNEYKAQFEKKWKEDHPEEKPKKDEKDPNAALLDKLTKMEERMQKMDDERSKKEEENAKKATLDSIKKGLEERFKASGREMNNYVMKQTLRDIEIPAKDANVKSLIKDAEKAYDEAMKDAGLDDAATPRFRSNMTPSKGKSALDKYFADKSKRESWKK